MNYTMAYNNIYNNALNTYNAAYKNAINTYNNTISKLPKINNNYQSTNPTNYTKSLEQEAAKIIKQAQSGMSNIPTSSVKTAETDLSGFNYIQSTNPTNYTKNLEQEVAKAIEQYQTEALSKISKTQSEMSNIPTSSVKTAETDLSGFNYIQSTNPTNYTKNLEQEASKAIEQYQTEALNNTQVEQKITNPSKNTNYSNNFLKYNSESVSDLITKTNSIIKELESVINNIELKDSNQIQISWVANESKKYIDNLNDSCNKINLVINALNLLLNSYQNTLYNNSDISQEINSAINNI